MDAEIGSYQGAQAEWISIYYNRFCLQLRSVSQGYPGSNVSLNINEAYFLAGDYFSTGFTCSICKCFCDRAHASFYDHPGAIASREAAHVMDEEIHT